MIIFISLRVHVPYKCHRYHKIYVLFCICWQFTHTHIREMVPDPQQQETPVTSNKKTPEVPRNSLLVPPIEKPVAVIHRGVSKI